jgi:hypothetical protein
MTLHESLSVHNRQRRQVWRHQNQFLWTNAREKNKKKAPGVRWCFVTHTRKTSERDEKCLKRLQRACRMQRKPTMGQTKTAGSIQYKGTSAARASKAARRWPIQHQLLRRRVGALSHPPFPRNGEGRPRKVQRPLPSHSPESESSNCLASPLTFNLSLPSHCSYLHAKLYHTLLHLHTLSLMQYQPTQPASWPSSLDGSEVRPQEDQA